MTRSLLLHSALLLLAAIFLPLNIAAQEARIEAGQRELAAVMLHDVHQDIKTSYYDPKYHGIDLDARYKQAGDLIKRATSFNQALGVVEWYLEPLDDSH